LVAGKRRAARDRAADFFAARRRARVRAFFFAATRRRVVDARVPVVDVTPVATRDECFGR
jgi:hypothetical protein